MLAGRPLRAARDSLQSLLYRASNYCSGSRSCDAKAACRCTSNNHFAGGMRTRQPRVARRHGRTSSDPRSCGYDRTRARCRSSGSAATCVFSAGHRAGSPCGERAGPSCRPDRTRRVFNVQPVWPRNSEIASVQSGCCPEERPCVAGSRNGCNGCGRRASAIEGSDSAAARSEGARTTTARHPGNRPVYEVVSQEPGG